MNLPTATILGFLAALAIGAKPAITPKVVREARAIEPTPQQRATSIALMRRAQEEAGAIHPPEPAGAEPGSELSLAQPATASAAKVFIEPPTAVIESSVKQTVPGRLVMLSAKPSTGVKRLKWYVEPSAGIDIELVEEGWRCVLVPNQPIKYRVTLVVTSPDGELADATLDLPPLVAEEAAADVRLSSPAVIHTLGAKPDYGALVRGIAAKLKGNPAEAAALAGSLRSAAGRIATAEIRTWEEMDRAVTVLVRDSLGPLIVNWAPVIEELDRALENERGSDMQRLHTVLFDMAKAIDGQ